MSQEYCSRCDSYEDSGHHAPCAALTESRREVEFYRGRLNDSTRDGSRLEAENATLRQEVAILRDKTDREGRWSTEAHKALGVCHPEYLGEQVALLRRQVEEQAASLEKVTRSWEEQAAKLAEVLGRKGEDFKGLVNSLAAAQERIKELEERLPRYHNEKQCGVIAERIERAESSLAAMTRERDEALAVVAEYKFGQTASARILRERDAALSRADALEKAVIDARDKASWLASYSRLPEYVRFEVEALFQRMTSALAAPSEPKEGA
jgi:chromosome segregation ATPase